MSRRKMESAPEVTVTLPLGELPENGYEAEQATTGRMHLNLFLRHKAAGGLLRLRNGLREANAKFDDGRPVYTAAEALRYLLEAVADGTD